MFFPEITHHGAVNGVTSSFHELKIDENNAVLVDCGLFQGAEVSANGSIIEQLAIDFPIQYIQALLVTHCHIDHVGRIPYLMAAGFDGYIYCSEPTAVLLPLVLEDAVKIGLSKDPYIIKKFLKLLGSRIIPIPYGKWQAIALAEKTTATLNIKLKPAGPILGSAYIETKIKYQEKEQRITFSGGLGGPYTPLLPNPKPPMY